MPEAARKTIMQVLLLLGGGTLIGWYYDAPLPGMLAGALLATGWHLRMLLLLERFLRQPGTEAIPDGSDLWSEIFSKINYLQQRRRWHKQRYRELLKEVRKSTNAMTDGAIVLNENEEVLFCNKAATSLAGFKRKRDRGQRVDNIIRDPAFVSYLKSGKYDQAIEIPSTVRDGDWLSCRIVPYGAGQRLLLIRDISERKRLAKMRRDFVANASHELRSPLTVISGYLDAMVDDPAVAEEWTKPLAQMQAQAVRMNRIVAELLELSRLEVSGTASKDEDVDICGLFAAAKKSTQNQAMLPEIVIDCSSQARLRGKSAEIECVILNLLSNALCYTPQEGTVRLLWKCGPEGGELTVADTGEGVPEDSLPRLTERFFRVDNGRSRSEGGVGLGLAIVKHVVGRHDGELLLESRLGHGTTVRCLFPPGRLTADPAGDVTKPQ